MDEREVKEKIRDFLHALEGTIESFGGENGARLLADVDVLDGHINELIALWERKIVFLVGPEVMEGIQLPRYCDMIRRALEAAFPGTVVQVLTGKETMLRVKGIPIDDVLAMIKEK